MCLLIEDEPIEMASIEELENSIQQYELQVCIQWFNTFDLSEETTIYINANIWLLVLQLSQVGETIKVCETDEEKSSLENLKSDLQELLDLTRETLNEQHKGSSAEGASTNDDDDPFGQEMALFMSEINESESQSAAFDQNENANNEDVHKFKVCTLYMFNV